ncbi:hypothetical protein COY26_01340 [Candidatus Woesearchaeota archaeon CG_4_10_14_0_2_um_filter_33_10]|nr:MAG: hypothetical protein COY26_01340 [Candidatus Woesearchaeota archaeon CG_4_10_14_0_2_um_filter_33_10]
MIHKKIFMILILFCFILPIVSAQNFVSATYLTITAGIFATLAFFIVTSVLWKNRIGIGPWILVSSATLFITASEIFRVIIKNSLMHQLFLTVAIILLFIVALIKYWDTIELTE